MPFVKYSTLATTKFDTEKNYVFHYYAAFHSLKHHRQYWKSNRNQWKYLGDGKFRSSYYKTTFTVETKKVYNTIVYRASKTATSDCYLRASIWYFIGLFSQGDDFNGDD
jgi:hypothetical protein